MYYVKIVTLSGDAWLKRQVHTFRNQLARFSMYTSKVISLSARPYESCKNI